MSEGDQLVIDRLIDMVRECFSHLSLESPPLFVKNYTCTYESQPEKKSETMKRTFQITFPYNRINITADDVECCLKTDEHARPDLHEQIHIERIYPDECTDIRSRSEITVLKQALQKNIKALTVSKQTNEQLERCNAELNRTVGQLSWACGQGQRELKEARETFASEAASVQGLRASLGDSRAHYQRVWNEREDLRKENRKLKENLEQLEEQTIRLRDLKSAMAKSVANLREECNKKDGAVASMYDDLQSVCRDNMSLQLIADRLTEDLRQAAFAKILVIPRAPYPDAQAFRDLHRGLQLVHPQKLHAFIEDWLHNHMVPDNG